MDKRTKKLFGPDYIPLLIVFIVFTVVVGIFDIVLGFVGASLIILTIVYIRQQNRRKRREIARYLESTLAGTDGGLSGSLLSLPIPALVCRVGDKRILWGNNAFYEAAGITPEAFLGLGMDDIFPKQDIRWLASGGVAPEDVKLNSRLYAAYGSMARQPGRSGEVFATIYLVDVTEARSMSRHIADRTPVVAILMIDNYEEIYSGLSDAARSQMVATLEEKLSEWAMPAQGLFRRFERDKYLFIFEEQYLKQFIEDKFSVLDTTREIVSPNGISASLSIGMGKSSDTLLEDLSNAQFAVDMALSRGGDQVVIRNKIDFSFYGGRTRTVEKRTKVKSRVMANALTEMITDSSQVLVMGHKNPDLDAIGSAIGVCCICRKLGKRCSIILNTKTSPDAIPLYEKMMSISEYRDVFISSEDALLRADVRTLLIVVDVSRPVVVESLQLLESCTRIAVIDHHRRAADYIEKVDLNFHEPYASSASEMVTELISYIMEHQDVLRSEAEALLAGITLDTKNFALRTGVRTFEAAAWLRRAGADTIEVKKLFQNNLANYIARSDIVKNTQLYRETIAISVCDRVVERTVASQAADELLSIRNVAASFVVFPVDDYIYISGRSLGQVNVQMVLEKAGGGGHATMAAAQIRGRSLEESVTLLTQCIDTYLDSLN